MQSVPNYLCSTLLRPKKAWHKQTFSCKKIVELHDDKYYVIDRIRNLPIPEFNDFINNPDYVTLSIRTRKISFLTIKAQRAPKSQPAPSKLRQGFIQATPSLSAAEAQVPHNAPVIVTYIAPLPIDTIPEDLSTYMRVIV